MDASAGPEGKLRSSILLTTVSASTGLQFDTSTDAVSDYNTGESFTHECTNMTGPMECSCSKDENSGSVLDQFDFSNMTCVGDATVAALLLAPSGQTTRALLGPLPLSSR